MKPDFVAGRASSKNFIESPKAQYKISLKEKQAAQLVRRYESMLTKLQRLNSVKSEETVIAVPEKKQEPKQLTVVQ